MCPRKKPVYRYNYNWVHDIIVKWSDFDTERRYRMDIILKPNYNRSVLVIMMNPSRANKEISDKTINNVIKYIYKNKNTIDALKNVGRIIVSNLYVVYETDSSKLNQLIKKNGVKYVCGNDKNGIFINDIILSKILPEIDSVIVGWGYPSVKIPSGYKTRIKDILGIIDKKDLYHVGPYTNKKAPRHARNWTPKLSLKKIKDPYNEMDIY